MGLTGDEGWAGSGGGGLRRECVRGLGGLPCPGKPRPFPVLVPSARNSFRKILGQNALGTAGSSDRARPGEGSSLGAGEGRECRADRCRGCCAAAEDPWKNLASTLSNPTALQGGEGASQGQRPLGDSAPLLAAGVPSPAPASGALPA